MARNKPYDINSPRGKLLVELKNLGLKRPEKKTSQKIENSILAGKAANLSLSSIIFSINE